MDDQGLYVKFNMLIVGTIFFCGLIMGGMLLHTTNRSLEDGLVSSGQELAVSLAVTVGNDILLDDRFAIQERLSKTMDANQQVRYIIITYPNGEVMATTFSEGFPKGLPAIRHFDREAEIDAILLGSNEGRIKEIMVPIDDGLIGYIRIGMTEKIMMATLQERCLEIALAVFLVCVLAALLATRYAQGFLRPIRKLAFGVKQLRMGKYGVRVPVYSSDEVGNLAVTFNEMSAQLKTNTEENTRLLEELRKKEQDRAWLISQLFTAREDEQRRISRELHDESSQSMASILTYLRILHDRLDTDEQREMLFEIRELTAATLGGIRQMAVDLHPPLLDDLGLIVAIEKYLDPIKRMNTDIDIVFNFNGEFSALPKPVSLMCYRTLQESVTNSLKHANASSLKIMLSANNDILKLSVEDDGVGFDENQAEQARLNRHLGLVSMRERTELLQGKFTLTTGKGAGTRIEMELPVTDVRDMTQEERETNEKWIENPVG